jgi:hypothetical protein
MPQFGDAFVVKIKPSHLGWGTYRHAHSRGPIYGEGYIKIPSKYAVMYGIFNNNNPGNNALFDCTAINGTFRGTLLAQGCSNAGDIYAKQFAEYKNLQGIGNWYRSVNAHTGGRAC